jgi:hypothetical protein
MVRPVACQPYATPSGSRLWFASAWLAGENPARIQPGGAPRIYGELMMLGFDISERTVSRWMRCAPRDPEPAKRWLAFLGNHREAIAAMDFFTVPTIRFDLLYCFFVISHGRRRVLHFNVTAHPTCRWIVQQLREVFPISPLLGFLSSIGMPSTAWKFRLWFGP